MEELISVIVPCFNSEKSLTECVKSITRQTYSQLDIILVDDGSTDKTLEVAHKIQMTDCRIKVLHQENQGAGSARNSGILQARGSYIVFVDSDDTILPEYCEVLLESQQKHKDSFIIVGIAEQQENGKQRDFLYTDETENLVMREDIVSVVKKGLLNSSCGKIYKKSSLMENHILMEQGTILGEDLLFNLAYIDLENLKTILTVNQALYLYTICGKESVTHRRYQNRFQMMRYIRKKQACYFERWKVHNLQDFFLMVLEEQLYCFKENYTDIKGKKREFTKNGQYMQDEFYIYVVNQVISSKWQKKIYLGNSYTRLGIFLWFQEKKRAYKKRLLKGAGL